MGVDGTSLLNARTREQGASTDIEMRIAKNPLQYVQQCVADQNRRPITFRFQMSTGEITAGELAAEARRGFSVLFMSSQLGLSFNLGTGVPVVEAVRPVFTAPRSGDVLTAIYGAELSKCALTVSQLVLMLEALPRPITLSFVDGSQSLEEALKVRNNTSPVLIQPST